MSDQVETGGTVCSDEEAHVVMAIMFAPGVGDVVRLLRAYVAKAVAEALAASATQSAEVE